MKKRTLSNKEKRELNEKLVSYEYSVDKKDTIQEIEYEKYLLIVKNDEPLFFRIDDTIYPTLKLLLKEKVAVRSLVVDMGAVKFIVNGADVMRPGIVEIDENIKKDDVVVIYDVQNKKPLVVGICLYSAEELKEQNSGKSVRNVHYIGDEIWNS